ncbi:STM4012 family radical SAM protein [Paenibacillus ginsengarvi]|uniref:Heme chaperone HemW n=1 Tax=Paenibacillus ginsengarvi TaxID=400777 RepID=A0A3B0BV67_9BACL|nr:STM4012 family radical SAM protein [Paenibacillus ginsengarvi]RKN75897.1 coproporphyrinogen III oxidase family protein [Paenibacillus ginsengarvi]
MNRPLVSTPSDAGSWSESLRFDPYRAYLYSYPHKTAYRRFETPLPIADLWRDEPQETRFLYMHIPFCGARCGFCNLFTLPDKRSDVHVEYVDALERQARGWAPHVSGKPFARFAVGGGTPTLLEPKQLERLFDIAEHTMGLDVRQASISVETSPETVTADRLDVLKRRHVDRVSMGIQSFIEAEAAAIYRPQKPDEVERALTLLKRDPFPVLNLDLIYGLPGQTVQSWLYSLERALTYEPEEIFLYPLYTREQTILKPEQIQASGADIRLDCYVAARDRLLAEGYEQHSMRRFSRPEAATAKTLLPYGCQEEGMVGLGCGARSYTRRVHYASRYAVSRAATAGILADYVAAVSHDTADYGYVLNEDEQRRRFVVKAILHSEGLTLAEYAERFPGREAIRDVPELGLLLDSGLALDEQGTIRLTSEGMAYSDAIGEGLISPQVRELMEGYEFA